MKVLRLFMITALVAALFTQCKKDNLTEGSDNMLKKAEMANAIPGMSYTLTVENVSTPYLFFESGVAAIPSGASEAGPALPGHSFQFSFHAGPSHKLSFATMYGFSNDGFYAPDTTGISLYDGSGMPLTGDVTSQIMLWDAGTQGNQMPGMDNPHDGGATEDPVQLMSAVGDGYDYGMVDTNLKVTLAYDGDHMFTVTVDNLAGSTTAISPVVWVVHTATKPLFATGMKDYGDGLQKVAEMGDATDLGHYLWKNSGYVSPIAPVLWVINKKKEMPIFTEGTSDRGMGLEKLAETGDPSDLYASLMDDYNTGVYAVPDGEMDGGPIFPGQKYTISFNAVPGHYLSIASMLGNSNDEFFAFDDGGIKLPLDNGVMDITDQVMLWDAGTEPNEYPGTKTDNEDVEGGNVRMLNDGYPWPDASKVIKVTIQRNIH